MSVDRQSYPPEKRTQQYMQGWSFDEAFNILATHGMGYDGQNLVRNEATDQQIKVATSGIYTYICKSAVGTAEATAKWKIFRLDTDGNKLYADGDANYDNVATDPTALSYSYS